MNLIQKIQFFIFKIFHTHKQEIEFMDHARTLKIAELAKVNFEDLIFSNEEAVRLNQKLNKAMASHMLQHAETREQLDLALETKRLVEELDKRHNFNET